MATLNTGFLEVFESKLKKLISSIERELLKPKAERNKKFLKASLKEARTLRKLVRECRQQRGELCCPKCNYSFGA